MPPATTPGSAGAPSGGQAEEPAAVAAASGRLRWYLNRLRAMSPPELAHRLQEEARRRLSRLRPLDPAVLLLPGAEEALPELPGLRAGLARLAARGDLAARLAAQAAAVGRGEVQVFGRPWPCMPEPNPPRSVPERDGSGCAHWPVPDWHWDPDSESRWPAERFCFDIPFRHGVAGGDGAGGGPADAKHVWELNRLTYLQPVAAHACLSGEAPARQACLRHLGDWLARNPPYRGINWASGIELAMRCVSLLAVLALLDARTLPAALRRCLALSLAAHGYWLQRFPSRFSSANNHLVAELAGLFLLGSLFPGLRPAAGWEAAGRQGLEAEIGRQILDDGSGAEQAPAYAALSLEWFALAAQVGAALGRPFSAAYLDRLARAGAWLREIADRNGAAPDIGDADGSSLFPSEVPQPLYPAAVRGVLAQVTGRPELAPPQVVPGLRHALFGLPAAGSAASDGLRTFPDGGLTVLRWAVPASPQPIEALLLLDHGPLGYLSIAAHGHADALAVWLHLDGRPVLADAGTWLYLGAGPWRDHFRGTPAHNTLSIAGLDSSRPAGPFNWRARARARLLRAGRDGAHWHAAAEHDGFVAATGYRHRRMLQREGPGLVRIVDELVGDGGEVPVEIGFQFAADLDVTESGGGWTVARAGRPVLALRHEGGLTGRVAAGVADPPQGWVSPRFGIRCPAPRLAFRGTMRGGEKQAFTLSIG